MLRMSLAIMAVGSLLAMQPTPAAEALFQGGSDVPAPGVWRWSEGLRGLHGGAEPANLTFAYWGAPGMERGWWRLSLGQGLALACDWGPGSSHAEVIAAGSAVLANGTCAMEHRARATQVALLVGVSFEGTWARGLCRELALPFAPHCDVQLLGVRPEVGDRVAGRGRFLATAWHVGAASDPHKVVEAGGSAGEWPGSWTWVSAGIASADDPFRGRLAFQWQRYDDGHTDGWWNVALDHGGYVLQCSEDHVWAALHEESAEGDPVGWGLVEGPLGGPLEEVACRVPIPPSATSFARPRTWGRAPGEPCARLPGAPLPLVPADCESLRLDQLDGRGTFLPPT